jgi:amidase
VKTLTELREWNLAHAKAGAIRYGQSRLDISDEMDLEADRARNDADVKMDQLLSRTNGIDAALEANRLDAILTPAANGADLAARAGYPLIVVPFGRVPNAPQGAPPGDAQQRQGSPFPAGFNPKPAPFGVGFTGTACSEPRLLGIAYAFEQATKRRVPPEFAP